MAVFERGLYLIRSVLMIAAAMVVGMIPMAPAVLRGAERGARARRRDRRALVRDADHLLIVPYLFAMLRNRNDGVAAYGVFEDLLMNDLFRPNRNDAIDRNRQDSPTFHREIEKQPRHRTHVRCRRRGGRLSVLGRIFAVCRRPHAGRVGVKALKQEVSGGRQSRSAISCRAACRNRRGESRDHFGSACRARGRTSLPRTFGVCGNRLYREAQAIGDRVKGRSVGGARSLELDHQISQNEADARSAQVGTAAGALTGIWRR